LSVANAAIGNSHEALGNARRASTIERSAPVILQIMRCENKLGDYYAALAAFEQLAGGDAVPPEIRFELGTAYAGLDEREKALAQYRAALGADPPAIAALRALLALHAAEGDAPAIEKLIDLHGAHIERDFTCMYSVGIAALHRGDREAAKRAFDTTLALAPASPEALHDDAWPVPEPRIRHDCEQLELLERRGKLDRAGQEALKVLQRYYDPRAGAEVTIAPSGAEGQALKQALSRVHYLPDPPYEGRALGDNDYAAIEDRYRRERLVVIDGFLSPAALAAFREYSEEATVWNAIYNPRGYVGAVLAQGFSPRVLLAIGDELRRAMPNVIADQPLLQAWGFKYDQRMQGINMHADFARVNVNFWLAPDEACEDLATGGLVVYDEPVPKSWTFADYNSDPARLAAYVHVRGAEARRVPYRGNRCVLFDSSLIHVTDEVHFRPGYENRRVNVTLLYGKALSVY
jgi:tetratricopeptide (TPR) repeat protein